MSSERSPTAAPLAAGAVRVEDLEKRYVRGGRSGLRALFGRQEDDRLIHALDGVDLALDPGASLGLIGPNGSGKSTLLKVLAGVTGVSGGRARCGGVVGSMIELELGFHPDLTGRENLQASAALAGVGPGRLRRLMPAVEEFAGLGGAIDVPLKQYSTGMRARLGFALATNVPADVLLVDEVLAVGDLEFQRRCVDRIVELVSGGTTLVFVSHELHLIDAVCERTMRLEEGRVVDDGPSAEVIERYLTPAMADLEQSSSSSLRISALDVRTPEVRPWGSVALEVGLELDEDLPGTEVAVQVSWKAIAPDVPIGYSTQPLPNPSDRRGRHRLVGVSTPIPLDSGHARVEVAAVGGADRKILDSAVGEVWIAGRSTRQQPLLALEVDWELDPVPPGHQPPVAPRKPGQPAAGLEAVTKQYSTRWHGSRALSGRRGAEPARGPVLDGVSLTFDRGEVTGVIGPNGAGKTTMLRLLAGVTAPTSGNVWTEGRVVSMLDLGVGFHPDLSGIENVHSSARLLGLSRADLARNLPDLLAFAGIGDAVDDPVRHYSTGMRARLGLALAMHCEPDVILIDETLAVGDQEFRTRAIDRLREVCRAGAAGLFVSHELDVVAEVADRVVHIDRGQVVADGATDEVLATAGGRIADRGVRQVTNALRLHLLEVSSQHIASGQDLVVEGTLEVVETTRPVRLELSYRAHPDRRVVEIPRHELPAHTMLARVVEPAGGRLSEAGWYRYRAVVRRNAFLGDLYVILTAIDELDGTVVAEVWHDVVIGTRGANRTPQIVFDVDWEVESDR